MFGVFRPRLTPYASGRVGAGRSHACVHTCGMPPPWRGLYRTLVSLPSLCIVFGTALYMAICAMAICMAWHITYLFFGSRWRCCCLCVLFLHLCSLSFPLAQHDMQHTCAASFLTTSSRVSRVTAPSYSLRNWACNAWSHTCCTPPPWRGSLHTCSLLVYILPCCAYYVVFERCAAYNILVFRRLVALLLFMCVLFWGAHKSLAPRARTLLGGLGQATLSFFAAATLLFFFFCKCPKFCDLAKQRRKAFGGVSEVGKDDFSDFFFWRCVVFLVFLFFCSVA